MQVIINPSKAKGQIWAPPSKSMAHRMLICAGLSRGTSTVKGLSFSQDVLATIDCLTALGARIETSGDTVKITGADLPDIQADVLLNCRECGSTLRFMIPLCMTSAVPVHLTGSTTLMERPLDVYKDIALRQGLKYEVSGGVLTLQGDLKPGDYEITGSISSQFVTGLLFSLPLLDGDSTLRLIPPVESKPYIDMTLQSLNAFGIKITEKSENIYYIEGNQTYTPCDICVEGDYSNSAFLDALNLFEGEVRVEGLNPQSYQGDKIYLEYFKGLTAGQKIFDISDCPDLGPILFAAAAALGGAEFTGTKRLKWKESDRAGAMAEELAKCGVSVDVKENSVTVYGKAKAPSDIICGHNDHRIVMAMAVLLTKLGGTIDGAEAIKKSYPDFFDDLRSLGVEVEIDGMDK